MLVEPNLDILLSNDALENKFALVTLALKRARQLNDGSPYLTDTGARKPVSMALHEIAAGKISLIKPPDDEEEYRPRTGDDAQAAALAKALGGADPDSGEDDEELDTDVN
ncbi:MAG: DNA-directed RNA polymerase subunit omega [Candidatus Eremiobacterota bacterium]